MIDVTANSGLTAEETARLRALLKTQLFHEKFWSRAWAIVGYMMAINCIIYGALLFILIVVAGVNALVNASAQ